MNSLDNVPVSLFYQYWGKSSREKISGDIPDFHLLPYHGLDVAAVAQVWFENDPLLCEKLESGESYGSFQDLFLFLIAVHDIGKFSERFQGLVPEVALFLTGNVSDRDYFVRHDTMGYLLLKDIAREHLFRNNLLAMKVDEIEVTKSDWVSLLDPLFSASTGHHGKPPEHPVLKTKQLFNPSNNEAATQFVTSCAELFLSQRKDFFEYSPVLEDLVNRLSWLLAGITIVSDWVASDDDYFNYSHSVVPVREYYHTIALPRAREALRQTGVLPVAVSKYGGIEALFPKITTPTPVQGYINNCEISPGPSLFIIEDCTGSGKTEAALALAHRMMSEGKGEGIFLGLPTMATANAMYERLIPAYERLYSGNAHPSLVLSHSQRNISSHFTGSVLPSPNTPEEIEAYQITATPEYSGSAQCASWIADSRKKALLSHIGVGTVDQALMGVLPLRHQSLRLFGLSRHILIVDEIHSYDAYVHRLLCGLMEFMGGLGASIILLSATLSLRQKDELIGIFQRSIGQESTTHGSVSFPLVTSADAGGVRQVALDTLPDRKKQYLVEFLHSEDEAVSHLIDFSRKGFCSCWVRNTVHDAIRSYEQLVAQLGEERVMLFHSRFTIGDRAGIEDLVLKTFGKQSTVDERNGKVLVATQVVEQSLDLDFDQMVTDLAPVDLIIQRMGRVHRHNPQTHSRRSDRGNPLLHILTPRWTDSPDAQWYSSVFQKGAYVYPDHGRLYLTLSNLTKKPLLTIPDDTRQLIESVYSDEAVLGIPPSLMASTVRAEGKDNADTSQAFLNILQFSQGYRHTPAQWADDLNTPTRLSDQSLLTYLALFESGSLRPLIVSSEIPWIASQIAIPNRRGYVHAPVTPDVQRAIDLISPTLPGKGRFGMIIPLVKDGAGWSGFLRDGKGRDIPVHYDRKKGFVV